MNMFENNPVIEAGKSWYKSLLDKKFTKCYHCNEEYLENNVGIRSKKCQLCANNKARRSMYLQENDLHPSPSPPELRDLTPIEQAAVSLISPCLTIFKKSATATASRGNAISFAQNVEDLAQNLPRIPSDLPVLVLRTKSQVVDKYFKVNKKKVY